MNNFLKILIGVALVGFLPGLNAQNHLVVQGGNLVVTGGKVVLQNSDFHQNASFSQTGGTIKLTGNSASNLIAGSSLIAFYGLDISRTSGNIMLQQSSSISNSLNLNNGLLVVGNNIVEILPTGNILNGGASSYVKTDGAGSLAMTLAGGAKLFPVGNALYNPLTITNAGVSDIFNVNVADALLSNGNSGAPIPNGGVGLTWHLNELTAGGSDLTIQFQWNQSQEQTGFDRSMMTAMHHNSTAWQAVGANGSAPGANPYTFSASGIASLSPFALYGECLIDGDQDGFGQLCDCDDNNANVNPNAAEVCDGKDNDCDGLVDTADPDFVDNTPPNVVCQNHSVNLDAGGSASITPADVYDAANSSDDCGTINLVSVSPNTFGCADLGPNTVTLTVNDGNGNTATCTATVGVHDIILPLVSCPGNVSQSNDAGQCAAVVNYTAATATDNCSIASLTYSQNSGTSFPVGTTPVTATATDPDGNVASCTFDVTVTDDEAPAIVCPADLTVSNDPGQCSAVVNYSATSVSDNCVGVSTVLTSGLGSGATFPQGTSVETYTATDAAGNTASCSFTITVTDNEAPVAACLNPTVNLDASGNASLTTADVFDTANSTDNCSTPYAVFVTPNAFDCSNIGANTATLQIIDLAGNTDICVATIAVEDNASPTVVCKAASTSLDANGSASITPADVFDSGSDNCGTVNPASVSPSSFGCANVGTNTVTLTVNDGNGNTATCTATVTVNDNTAPTASCKNHTVSLDADGQASIASADVNDGSSDNCGIGGMGVSPASFGCANVGANTVTLTITDDNGNTATCTATVTVQDNIAPDALCQNFTTDLDPDGNYSLTPASVDNGSNDACGLTLSVSPNQFGCGEIGANTVTLTATDDSGNTSTCSATVTINQFATISSITSTPESCTGYGDGTITINATAVGGTLMYSINGGGSYQGNNVFTNVSPGTYNVKVLAQGTGCEASGTATVDPGGPGTTWYKDLDGDGYTDGITTTACSAPAGYVASAIPGDCNDNNSAIHPGAAEICDGVDNNCDGIIPADEQDNDADGYRICDGDCDDTDPAINPGATEVCNGIDDDCDGQIDEGAAATETWVGNVIFTSQAAVDNFSQCYNKIQGSLTIQGTGINSLAKLSNLEEVTGNITIQITSLPNLNGLDGLTTIGGTLTIKLNNYGAKLSSLSGLGNLSGIGQNLLIYFNFSLSDCCSIDDLLSNTGVGGATSIHHNAAGCNSVSDISTSCGGGSVIILPNNGIAFGETAEQPRMSLFPNPATSTVTILLEGLGVQPGTLTVSDQLGRIVLIEKLQPGQEVLDLDLAGRGINTGVYQLTLITDTQRLVRRLAVSR